MDFYSILFESDKSRVQSEPLKAPEFFTDLNIDQIIDEITLEKDEYNLKPFFYEGLSEITSINYRLEVMKELQNNDLFECLTTFSINMRNVRKFYKYFKSLHYQYQREKWLLDSAALYCNSVINLYHLLTNSELKSKGFNLFSAWLCKYTESASFRSLYSETTELQNEFGKIKYSLQTEGNIVRVLPDESNRDYCMAISETFENINEAAFDYCINFLSDIEMSALEVKILDILKSTNKRTFDTLHTYSEKYFSFQDSTIERFDREIQFYISYLQYIGKLKKAGFHFTYPQMSRSKEISVFGGYDLALAFKCASSGQGIVANDFYLKKDERIFVVTGPNQGGKTTFARTFGQIMFFTSLGCPVPCKKADLFAFDSIYTHFSNIEDLSNNEGRLKEELTRIKQILEKASADSLIIINELFASTTSHDAYVMGKKILNYFLSKDCICLYVTHIYELSLMNSKTVSMVADLDSATAANRTYKIVRKPADGIAYANSIVEKYNLTYNEIKERINK